MNKLHRQLIALGLVLAQCALIVALAQPLPRSSAMAAPAAPLHGATAAPDPIDAEPARDTVASLTP